MGTQSVNDFLRNALAQLGDRHQKGAEASLKDADPDAWDSSELVEWSANRAGVTVNDGSWLQYRQLHREGGNLSVEDALHTPGALVFTFSSDPLASRDRPDSAGVAISLGNGQIITVAPGGEVEVVDASTREFTHAAVMPGFEDARTQDADSRAELAALLADHDLAPPQPDLFDPDGDGVPMSPDEAKARIALLDHEAEQLRAKAEEAEERHDRRDADIEVAKAVLEEREADHERQKDALDRATRAEAEAASDLYRQSPDLRAASDEMVALRHRIGLPVPAHHDLIPPDGGPHPAPPPVETDPAVVEQLRGELVFAEAHVEQLLEDNRPFKDELDRRTAERQAAEAAEKVAADSVREQKADLDEVSEPLDIAEANEFLDVARKKEAEAEELVDRADDVAKRWDEYQAAHPDGPVTDLGEIEVRTSGAEAYAQGRRERAAELEDEAADLEAKAIADERAATERSELSDLRDERAEDLRLRAEEAKTRAADAERQAAEADEQMKEWAATADKRLADAARLRAQGRTEDADIMKARADRANEASIEQSLRSGELNRDVTSFNAQAAAWEAESVELAKTADLLDEEAAALSGSAKAADEEADELLERAATQDRHADTIDAAIDSGIATEIHIVDQVEGIDVTVPIPGREPVESDLDDLPGAQPQQPEFEQPGASFDEPQSDFTQETDVAAELFAGIGSDDDGTLDA